MADVYVARSEATAGTRTRQTPQRLTLDERRDLPVFLDARDSKQVMFASDRDGAFPHFSPGPGPDRCPS